VKDALSAKKYVSTYHTIYLSTYHIKRGGGTLISRFVPSSVKVGSQRVERKTRDCGWRYSG
jgi:hypothetical protein